MPRKQPKPRKILSKIRFAHLVRASWLHQVGQFFTESTLHGVRYIAEAGRPFWEHFTWFCLVLVSTLTTLCIILNLWVRFQTHPTITGPDTSQRFSATVFPTVLVCPVETAGFDEGKLDGDDELYNETLLAMSSYERIGQIGKSQSRKLAKVKIDNVREAIFRSVLDCEAVIGDCWFRGEHLGDCCKSFLPVFSEVGFCYGFSSKFYDTEKGWELNPNLKYIYETDKTWGLTFEPLVKSNVLIHSFDELSGWEFRPQVQWDEGFAIELLISMKQTYTTEDARQLSIGQRKCIFSDEVQLQYHPDEYTFTGCRKESRILKCLKRCGCVPPFYALKEERACGPADLPCLVKNLTTITRIGKLSQFCELGCNNTVYDIEKYSKVIASEAAKEPLITIEFLTWPVIRYKREVLFGWVDLLVSFGGIAGLFLGFSLLSGVEIIYFFTMRACCMLYKNRDQLETIEQEKLRRPPDRFNLELLPTIRRRRKPLKQPDPPSEKNVITLSLVEQDFNAVKIPKERGLVLGGLGSQPGQRRLLERRFEKMKPVGDIFQPVHVAPYSELIKPLDRNVIRTKDGGILYNGYLP